MNHYDDPMDIFVEDEFPETDQPTKESSLEATRRKIQELSDDEAKTADIQINISKDQHSMQQTGDNFGDASDDCSVYVGQVDYEATPEELQAHFMCCGIINRITILCDKITGQPKGYAYVEFATKEAAEIALSMNDSVFKGRNLKVTPKRQNIPGFTRGRGRGRPSYRGRGRGRPPYVRGRRGRGSYRGSYRGGYHPYY